MDANGWSLIRLRAALIQARLIGIGATRDKVIPTAVDSSKQGWPEHVVIDDGVNHQSSAGGHQQTHGYIAEAPATQVSPERNHITNLHQTDGRRQRVDRGQELLTAGKQEECNAKLNNIEQPADQHAKEYGRESGEHEMIMVITYLFYRSLHRETHLSRREKRIDVVCKLFALCYF
jgi:hypothetical protein